MLKSSNKYRKVGSIHGYCDPLHQREPLRAAKEACYVPKESGQEGWP